MPKPFLTFEKQIDHLVNNKNLIITNKNFALSKLTQIGYFGLIGGYKNPFKNTTTQKFKDGTTFEDIYCLYKFDENLRELFLKYLLQIERHLRSLLSYYFIDKYGLEQAKYLSKDNYNTTSRNEGEILKLINTLDTLASSTNYPYITHQRDSHHNVPLWVLINCVTFGTLSKFYCLSTHDLQGKVSKNFLNVNEKQLEQFLSVITQFRNVCAHTERLFSYKTKNDIPDTLIHTKLKIPKIGNQYQYGKHDLFSVVIAMYYLLPKENFQKFKSSLRQIINHYLKSTKALTKGTLFKQMGFIDEWENISKYKK